MNIGEHTEATASAPLPELSDERVDAIERALFADIASERTVTRARRGRWWQTVAVMRPGSRSPTCKNAARCSSARTPRSAGECSSHHSPRSRDRDGSC